MDSESAGDIEELSFTVDSSVTTFGGRAGVIQQIRDSLNTAFYDSTSGNGLFEKGVDVDIVNGDVVFTSRSHKSTSSISLTAGASGADTSYELFAAANGRIPILADIRSAEAARLPDDVTYDKITHSSVPNSGVFLYDDGNGKLKGSGGATGEISYETGACIINNWLPDAEFVVTGIHSTALSGRLNEAVSGKPNSIKDILATTPSQKWNGEAEVSVW